MRNGTTLFEYAKRYLNLVQDDYKVSWWKLFNSPDSTKWTNILVVVELLFCLPVSNGHLECVFFPTKASLLVSDTNR